MPRKPSLPAITRESQIKALTPRDKVYRVRVDSNPGWGSGSLFIQCQPSGSTSFVLRYQHNGAAKECRLGGYPALSLAAAKEKHTECGQWLAAGLDPAGQIRLAVEENRGQRTLAQAWDEYMVIYRAEPRKDGFPKTEKTIRAAGRRFDDYARATIGRLPLKSVSKAHIACCIKDAAAVAPASAHQLLIDLRRALDHFENTGAIESNPAFGIRASRVGCATPDKERRHLSLAEIRQLWRAIDYLPRQTDRHALQLQILLGTRSNEVSRLKKSAVHIAEKQPFVELQAMDMKARRQHKFFVGPVAVGILREALAASRPDSEYLFSRHKNMERPESGLATNRLNKSIDLLLGRVPGREERDTRAPLSGWSIFSSHALRRSYSTILIDQGADESVVRASIGQKSSKYNDGVSRAYNHALLQRQHIALRKKWEKLVSGQ
ncbi:Arm DNA-binding domain protein [compost metagenome]